MKLIATRHDNAPGLDIHCRKGAWLAPQAGDPTVRLGAYLGTEGINVAPGESDGPLHVCCGAPAAAHPRAPGSERKGGTGTASSAFRVRTATDPRVEQTAPVALGEGTIMEKLANRPMRSGWARAISFVFTLALFLMLPGFAAAETVANPICTNNTASFNPGNGQDIVVPSGFKVSVFAKALNFPTGIAFRGNQNRFEVFVLESGHGLPSRCNDETSSVVGGEFSPTNPFTPDILVFSASGQLIRTLAKPTANGGGLQAHGPAVDIGFERGLAGGPLFATDSNQSLPTTGFKNSSRIVILDPTTGDATPFITGLPTGHHPTHHPAVNAPFFYSSHG